MSTTVTTTTQDAKVDVPSFAGSDELYRIIASDRLLSAAASNICDPLQQEPDRGFVGIPDGRPGGRYASGIEDLPQVTGASTYHMAYVLLDAARATGTVWWGPTIAIGSATTATGNATWTYYSTGTTGVTNTALTVASAAALLASRSAGTFGLRVKYNAPLTTTVSPTFEVFTASPETVSHEVAGTMKYGDLDRSTRIGSFVGGASVRKFFGERDYVDFPPDATTTPMAGAEIASPIIRWVSANATDPTEVKWGIQMVCQGDSLALAPVAPTSFSKDFDSLVALVRTHAATGPNSFNFRDELVKILEVARRVGDALRRSGPTLRRVGKGADAVGPFASLIPVAGPYLGSAASGIGLGASLAADAADAVDVALKRAGVNTSASKSNAVRRRRKPAPKPKRSAK